MLLVILGCVVSAVLIVIGGFGILLLLGGRRR